MTHHALFEALCTLYVLLEQFQILQAFEDLHLTRKSIYFVTNFHEGNRGGMPLWNSSHKGFDKTNKSMVDLCRDLLNVADRFITRHYGQSKCVIL